MYLPKASPNLLLQYTVRSLRASDFVSARVFLQVIVDTLPYLALHRCPVAHPDPYTVPVVDLGDATSSDARKIVIDFVTEKILEHGKVVTKIAKVTGLLQLLILAYETIHGLLPAQAVPPEEVTEPDTQNTIVNAFLLAIKESPKPLCGTCSARARLQCVPRYLTLAYDARDTVSLGYLLTVLRMTTVASSCLDCSPPTSRETLKRKKPEFDDFQGQFS